MKKMFHGILFYRNLISSYISDLFRDEAEQEDFEERITLKLAGEEEEAELNRIKEESRKRRQAILEKYKSQPLQQQTQSQSLAADVNKGFFPINFYFELVILALLSFDAA